MATQTAGDAVDEAARSPWVERVGSLGFVAKGVLYVIVGAITGSIGFSGGSGEASSTGAISALSDQPFGSVLLLALAIGLVSLALLRLLHAFINPSGDTGMKGVLKRASYAVRFLIYGGLAVYAVVELFGSSGGGGQEEQLTGLLLGLPAGRWLVAVVAAVMLALAGYQLWKAWTQDFMEQLTSATSRQRTVTRWLGVFGHATRGVVFGTVAVLFARAALESDSSEAGGVDKAIDTLASSPFGLPVLEVLALGLICYGAFCIALGRWATARQAG